MRRAGAFMAPAPQWARRKVYARQRSGNVPVLRPNFREVPGVMGSRLMPVVALSPSFSCASGSMVSRSALSMGLMPAGTSLRMFWRAIAALEQT